jgi:hypothetical protein
MKFRSETIIRSVFPLAGLAFFLATTTALAADWSSWRGGTGQGICDEKDLPLTWGGKDETGVLWKVYLPGVEEKATLDKNQSSPIVVKGRVFVTTSYWLKSFKPAESRRDCWHSTAKPATSSGRRNGPNRTSATARRCW